MLARGLGRQGRDSAITLFMHALLAASDGVRRCGMNPRKRARLVRAGADLIVPDFLQGPALLDYLFAESS